MISILVESKFIAFTNDARKRFWNMDWNVVLLLQVKRCKKPHKNHKNKPKYETKIIYLCRFGMYDLWIMFERSFVDYRRSNGWLIYNPQIN